MATKENNESRTDIAYRLMLRRKKGRNFYELWEDVKAELAKVLTPEQMSNVDDDISFFYTSLTVDGRFVYTKENLWDLRERIMFDDIPTDPSGIYTDDSDLEIEDEDEENNDSSYSDSSDDVDESFDDDTGTDTSVSQYRDEKEIEDEENEE